jgi:hypothetical protein
MKNISLQDTSRSGSFATKSGDLSQQEQEYVKAYLMKIKHKNML